MQEIKILRRLSGGPNIVTLLNVVRNEQYERPSLVFEYVDNIDFRTLYPRFTDYDIRFYIYELLKALDFCHDKGIMHRAVKPQNVMIDHKHRKLRLIGWGSADFYLSGTEYNEWLGSAWIQAPELLLEHLKYDYSVDMWSVGNMFASMIFRREPFIHGITISSIINKIASILGTDDFFAYLAKHNIELDPLYREALPCVPEKSWQSLINVENERFADDEAIDFVDNLLRYDPNERLTAREALAHPYFTPVRCRQDDQIDDSATISGTSHPKEDATGSEIKL